MRIPPIPKRYAKRRWPAATGPPALYVERLAKAAGAKKTVGKGLTAAVRDLIDECLAHTLTVMRHDQLPAHAFWELYQGVARIVVRPEGLNAILGAADSFTSVEAELAKPQIEIRESSLAVALEGQATLTLHLGPRASGPSEVSLLGISLLAENAQSVLVESIAVRSEPSFPITVPLDSDRSAVLHIDGPDNSLSTNVKTTLCGASAVMLQVVLDDGLRGATTIATSGPFGLSGCP